LRYSILSFSVFVKTYLQTDLFTEYCALVPPRLLPRRAIKSLTGTPRRGILPSNFIKILFFGSCTCPARTSYKKERVWSDCEKPRYSNPSDGAFVFGGERWLPFSLCYTNWVFGLYYRKIPSSDGLLYHDY